MNTTHADGHQHGRGLRGDPVVRGTTDDGTRDPHSLTPQQLTQLYPHSAQAMAIACPEAFPKEAS